MRPDDDVLEHRECEGETKRGNKDVFFLEVSSG